MSAGLLALLDDMALIARGAAAQLDDVAAQTAAAGAKSAGLVIDDAAVTPAYVIGFHPDREIPIVMKIARGSLINKLAILLPGLLALSALAPWAITPLLVLGAFYLLYEGTEKALELVGGHGHGGGEAAAPRPQDPVALEEERVRGAIRTDLILSAEIMTIALFSVAAQPLLNQAVVMALVGVGITVLVYGGVAVIVKADDFGARLRSGRSRFGDSPLVRRVGGALIRGMPRFLDGLGKVGIAAMLWVGGGIVRHAIWPDHVAEIVEGHGDEAHAAEGGGLLGFLGEALVSGVFGLALGVAIVKGLAWARRRFGTAKGAT